jgi:hypothetical protein
MDIQDEMKINGSAFSTELRRKLPAFDHSSGAELALLTGNIPAGLKLSYIFVKRRSSYRRLIGLSV